MCVSVSVLWKDEGPRPGAGLGSRRHFETGCAGGAERRDPYADGGEFCLQAVKGLLFGRLPSPGLASQRLASPDQDLPAAARPVAGSTSLPSRDRGIRCQERPTRPLGWKRLSLVGSTETTSFCAPMSSSSPFVRLKKP